jgi:AI-2 transport protein TqsA
MLNPTRLDSSPGVRTLVILAYLVVAVAGLRIAAPILVPVAVAAFIAIVSLPALYAFTRGGIPRPLAIILVVLLDAAVLAFIGWIVYESATEVRAALPAYLNRFAEIEASALAQLQRWGLEVTAIPYVDFYQPEIAFDLATRALRGVTGAVSAAFLVLLLVVFMLGEAANLPLKIRTVLGDRANDVAHYARIVGEVQRYLALKTAISLATGLIIGVSAWFIGVDFALLWGLLAFLLNFIPSIGSIIAAIPALTVALLQLGLGPTFALALVYLAVNVTLGNFLEPTLMGRRLGLSTLVVLFSLLFWGWVWGITGMLLSLPLTMAAKIVFENTPDLRWLATMMGPGLVEHEAAALAPGRLTGVHPDPAEPPAGT